MSTNQGNRFTAFSVEEYKVEIPYTDTIDCSYLTSENGIQHL